MITFAIVILTNGTGHSAKPQTGLEVDLCIVFQMMTVQICPNLNYFMIQKTNIENVVKPWIIKLSFWYAPTLDNLLLIFNLAWGFQSWIDFKYFVLTLSLQSLNINNCLPRTESIVCLLMTCTPAISCISGFRITEKLKYFDRILLAVWQHLSSCWCWCWRWAAGDVGGGVRLTMV